jgi:hypothetical protein
VKRNISQRQAAWNWTFLQTLSWSDVIFEIFELDPLQFGATYEAFLNAIHPDDRKAVDEAYSVSVREKTPYQISIVCSCRMAGYKYVLERCEQSMIHPKTCHPWELFRYYRTKIAELL